MLPVDVKQETEFTVQTDSNHVEITTPYFQIHDSSTQWRQNNHYRKMDWILIFRTYALENLTWISWEGEGPAEDLGWQKKSAD